MDRRIHANPRDHSYLGEGENVNSRIFFARNEVINNLILIALRDIVLFPDETLPLRINDQFYINKLLSLLNNYGSHDPTIIGVINIDSSQNSNLVGVVGSIFEARRKVNISVNQDSSLSSNSLHPNDTNEITLTGKGRNRFRVKSTRKEEGVLYAKVEIIPDICEISSPYSCSKNVVNFSSSNSKPFPNWVYNFQCPRLLAREVYKLLCSSLSLEKDNQDSISCWGPLRDIAIADDNKNIITDGTTTTEINSNNYLRAEIDPTGFSYFAAVNLPLSTQFKQKLLTCDRVIERLRLLLVYLRKTKRKPLCCSQCGYVLSLRSSIFTVPGAEGMAGAYVNPHGIVHETITVSQLFPSASVLLQGSASTQDSWFPGFAWTIAYCPTCINHLGWRFTKAGATTRLTQDISPGSRAEFRLHRDEGAHAHEDILDDEMAIQNDDQTESVNTNHLVHMRTEINFDDEEDESTESESYVSYATVMTGEDEEEDSSSDDEFDFDQYDIAYNNIDATSNNSCDGISSFWGFRRAAVGDHHD